MKKAAVIRLLTTLLAVIFMVPWNRGEAIPAFARKYQISCQVCHSPVMPRLKAFGEDFAGNGFRMTEYESPRYFIPAGDEKLSLLRELPLAIRMDGFVSYNFNDEAQSDFGAPFVLKILSGGELSDKLSYYFYFLFNERGSVAGVEDALIMYRDLFRSGINLYLGQFQASDPLYRGELRYTLESYRIYGTSPGSSSADLKYDRGIILEKGFKTGTTVVGQVLNGCGIGEASEGYLFDKDKYKNFMLRINQDLFKNVSLGVFGYTGKELVEDPSMIYAPATSTINMFGPDISLNFDDKFVLNAQYLRRTDSQVFTGTGSPPLTDIITDGGFAELIYSPKGDMSNWYLTGLFNWVESDLDDLDYTSATLHAGYILRRNVRLVSEYTQVMNPVSYGKVNVGIVSAF
ncbi:MAG: hypothetical protein MUE32_03280 [Bacteroidales bacterium]|nr:hypothetical protein [Bacteroidales bacterium]